MIVDSCPLPTGYKQTEAGVVPNDWNARILGEIGTFKNGINKGSAAFGHGSPFVNLMDVFAVNSIDSVEHLGLVSCSSQERVAYDLKSGDVIFVRSSVKPSGVGLTAVVEVDLPETVYSGFLIRFRDHGFLDVGFKKHCFYEHGFRNRVIASSSVSANTNISQDSLRNLAIAVPPTKAEQEAIAEALGDADALIESLEQLVAKKRHLKQAAMQQLLTGKKRLPGFEGEWGTKRLGDMAEVTTGGTPSRTNPAYWNGHIPWVTTTEIDFKTITDAAQRITSDGLANSAAKLYPARTLLMALYGQGKTRGKVGILGIEAATNQACAAIEIRNGASPNYVLLNLMSRYDEIRDMSNTGNQENLNGQIVKDIVVPLPSPAEQAAITDVLTDMDAEITTLEAKLAKARQIKQGMMSNLLTGKIRLVNRTNSE